MFRLARINFVFLYVTVIASLIESCEEDTLITTDDDGTNNIIIESSDSEVNFVNMECSTDSNTNREVCKYVNLLSKLDTDTFVDVDTYVSVTLTLHVCT